MEPQPTGELRGTVRFEPDGERGRSGKRFRGVWLEFADGRRAVIDYQPRDVWRSFAERPVLAAGHCYEPPGQALLATHFEVERMRLVDRVPDVPLMEVGPEVLLRGALVTHQFPAGSKLAGSPQTTFRDDGGTEYFIHGADDKLPPLGPVAITARTVLATPSYVALPGGPRVWIFDFHAVDYKPDPGTARRRVPCPEG